MTIFPDHFSLQRVPPFESWRKDKLLVLHMQTPFLDVESCLKLANIPFKSFAYDEMNSESLSSEIVDCLGIIITGSWLGTKISLVKPQIPGSVLRSIVPKLGICFGYEELGRFLGANLIKCNPPFGEKSEVKIKLFESPLFTGLNLEDDFFVTMAHNFMLEKTPPKCDLIAETKLTPIAGFQSLDSKIFGLQFHPEKGWMGDLIFRNFFKYCRETKI